MTGDPTAAVLGDPRKRAYAAQFIGQAFVTAFALIETNRDKIANVANAVIDKKEIYGDELVRLLDAQNFKTPEIDWTDDQVWPNLMNWSKIEDPKDRAARNATPRARAAKAPVEKAAATKKQA
jgi:hypothetical protein